MLRIILAFLFLPTLSLGASFDCKMAATRVERLICANSELSSLDDSLFEAYSREMERTEFPSRLRAAQKVWLANRNGCADVFCILQRYEHRIAELSCDPNSALAGSAIGASQCAYFSLRELERELSLVEERYIRKVTTDNNNPDYLARTFKNEQSTWRNYRAAYCDHHGALEGGSDGWKNAWAAICEVDETKKRIARLRNEIGEK